jgi:hypothetical protein
VERDGGLHVSLLKPGFAGCLASIEGHRRPANPHLFETWGAPFWLTMRMSAIDSSPAAQNDTSKDRFLLFTHGK